MAYLELQHIYKTYDNVPLLNDVSFSVERGEIACLLGSSGSGKTTLLRIIAGLDEPERGTVHLEGRDLAGVPVHQRGIVLMFQEYALFPHRTVGENVAFGLRMKGEPKSRIAARVESMLSLVGLEGFEDRDVNELSGGEQQRVALARSLASHPNLLLLDEPLGALDRNLRERLLEELPLILRQVGVTTVTVTHDQEEAFALADRVILLNGGKVVQSGRPEDVYRHPVSTWAARFLGQSNLLAAEVIAPHLVATSIGQLVVGKAVPLPPIGTKGTLLIHDEGIHLTGDESNSFTAKVLSRSYHGYAYRINALLPGGKLNFMRTRGMTVPRVGETLSIHISPNALHWIPE